MSAPTPLEGQVARELEEQAGQLAGDWWRSTRSQSERDLRAGASGRGEMLVGAAIAALRGRRGWHDEATRVGWLFGCEAHRHRVPLHFVLEELDVLGTMLMLAASRCEAAASGSATEGLAIARRITAGISTVRLAASRGYTRAVVEELRHHYRQLRHGLRNPLGTIKGALALMDDETVPEADRRSGRFRIMAERNTTRLDSMIDDVLGDAAAQLPAFAYEPVSLRAIAAAVRREVAADVADAQVEVIVADGLPTVQLDAAGLELVLRSALLAILRDVSGPAEVMIDLGELRPDAALLTLTVRPETALARPVDQSELGFARELAAATGGSLWSDQRQRVCVELPISGRQSGDDLARPRERPHLEARAE